MPKFEVSATIERRVEDVFAVMSNVENNPKWSSSTLEAEQTSAGPMGLGSTNRFVNKVLGRRIESESEITEFEPNHKFSWQSKSGPFPINGSVTTEESGAGTRLTFAIEAEPAGFFKLAEPLVVSAAKRQFQSDLQNLKELMEANAL